MATVREIEQSIFDWAPQSLAMEWDNVGQLVGDPNAEVRQILVALDITEAVADEAIACGADLIVSHHPVMNCHWHSVQTVRTDDRQGRILTKLIRGGISAICMHTNLDAAQGGVNDLLAAALGVCDAASFREDGVGRMGTLKCKKTLEEFLPDVIQSLGCHGVRYRSAGKPVYRVAVGGGACGDYIGAAIASGCDTFVTSDLSYHQFLDTTEINLIDAGHYPTENLICPAIVSYLSAHFPQITIVSSASHRDAIEYFM